MLGMQNVRFLCCASSASAAVESLSQTSPFSRFAGGKFAWTYRATPFIEGNHHGIFTSQIGL
jgi:hypothetical protein